MNTIMNANYMRQFNRVVRVLVWSGLGICVAAATIFDIGNAMLGWR